MTMSLTLTQCVKWYHAVAAFCTNLVVSVWSNLEFWDGRLDINDIDDNLVALPLLKRPIMTMSLTLTQCVKWYHAVAAFVRTNQCNARWIQRALHWFVRTKAATAWYHFTHCVNVNDMVMMGRFKSGNATRLSSMSLMSSLPSQNSRLLQTLTTKFVQKAATAWYHFTHCVNVNDMVMMGRFKSGNATRLSSMSLMSSLPSQNSRLLQTLTTKSKISVTSSCYVWLMSCKGSP